MKELTLNKYYYFKKGSFLREDYIVIPTKRRNDGKNFIYTCKVYDVHNGKKNKLINEKWDILYRDLSYLFSHNQISSLYTNESILEMIENLNWK